MKTNKKTHQYSLETYYLEQGNDKIDQMMQEMTDQSYHIIFTKMLKDETLSHPKMALLCLWEKN